MYVFEDTIASCTNEDFMKIFETVLDKGELSGNGAGKLLSTLVGFEQ